MTPLGKVTYRTRKAYSCLGAGATCMFHHVAAGEPVFVFRRQFVYRGALYASGSRVCLEHARSMGVHINSDGAGQIQPRDSSGKH